MAPRCHGRPHAGLCADPRGDMVAAGVYLVARSYGIFAPSPTALMTVAWIGGITAIFAATIALVMEDIKKVLAYSTVSQLGFMMVGTWGRRVYRGHLSPRDPRHLQGPPLLGLG